MEWIKPDININFVGFRYKAFLLSGIIIFLGVFAMIWRGGLNMGVDFAGGTLVQVQFNKPTTPDDIRAALRDLVSQSTIQQIGSSDANEYLIRAELMTSELESLSDQVQAQLAKVYGEGQATVRRVEMVGPKVGEDLRQKALKAVYYALLFISIYISGRFEFKWAISGIMGGLMLGGIFLLEAMGVNVVYLIVAALITLLLLCWFLKLPYALGAVLSLVHDILITLGIFALTNKEFTLEVFAAVLMLSGFSLNDTIVVFDRIRENRHKDRKQPFHDMINGAINQTLSRTILTSGTILFVVICLFFLGGTVIHDFSFALLIGMVTGTYSSIFVASPIIILYEDLSKGKRVLKKATA
jgi:preprotein translocase subunit SecF